MIGWNSAGEQAVVGEELRHRRFEHAVGRLVSERPGEHRTAQRGDARAPLTGVALNERPQPGRKHQPRDHDVLDSVRIAWFDGGEIAQHPQRVGHR